MPLNPVEAEATGQEFITAAFKGAEFRIPLDVDSWPLDLIRGCRGMRGDQVVPNIPALLAAMRGLLGTQWRDFLDAAPERRNLAEASNAFAAAVGLPGNLPADVAFGAIPRVLMIIDTWPDKVESDLDRFWSIDYTHRFLFQAGRRRLTLRRIHTRLENLPVESALAIAMNDGKFHKTGAELLLMDLYEALRGTRHPSRPMSAQEIAERDGEKAKAEKAKADYEKRKAARSGVLNQARANAEGKAVRAQED